MTTSKFAAAQLPKVLARGTPAYQEAYQAFAQMLYRTNILSDPWLYGEERFLLEPILISETQQQALYTAAEAIGKVYDELAALVWRQPEYLDTFFGLTPYQKLMWLTSGGSWHFIARLDVFEEQGGGIKICEMNSDTPSGEAEAVLLNELLHKRVPHTRNPNANFEETFITAMLAAYHADVKEPKEKPTIGIIYPTDLPEDLSMILLYKSWFERHGFTVVLGSPLNLRKTKHALQLFSQPIDIAIRHYKTDWWGEREPVWLDEEEYPDPYPMHHELLAILEAEEEGRVSVLNPFGAVLTQNKLTMAFLWKYRAAFSPEAQAAIEAYIPETHRLVDMDIETLLCEQEKWVLKSDYGCEGAEVIIGKLTAPPLWKLSLEQAIKERWIAQRFFEAKVLKEGGIANFGVYLIGGKACGFYTRVSHAATDYTTPCAAVFIDSSINKME
ncbi:MAG: glutathionylspermidine synthase family protein [Candidatus Thermochlorobacter sp.]